MSPKEALLKELCGLGQAIDQSIEVADHYMVSLTPAEMHVEGEEVGVVWRKLIRLRSDLRQLVRRLS